MLLLPKAEPGYLNGGCMRQAPLTACNPERHAVQYRL